MPRRLLAATLLLAALSVGMGLMTPTPFPAGHLYVVGPDQAVVQGFDENGTLQPVLITGLTSVVDVTFGPGGVLYTADVDLGEVAAFDAAGQTFTVVDGLDSPSEVLVGTAGRIYVAVAEADEVIVVNRIGTLLDTLGAGSGLDDPQGLALGPDGHLYVTSAGTGTILEFDAAGAVVDQHGAGLLDDPRGLAFGRAGHLYVADRGGDVVVELDADGALVTELGTNAGLSLPTDVAVGPERHLYVTCEGTDEVRVLDPTGNLVGLVGPGHLSGPTGLAFAPLVASGSVKGRLTTPGGQVRRQSASLSITHAPGTGRVMVELLEADPELVELLGGELLVFSGHASRSAPAGAAGKASVAYAGAQLAGPGRRDGVLFLTLDLQGTLDADGRFTVSRFSGQLQALGPDGSYDGRLKQKGKLP